MSNWFKKGIDALRDLYCQTGLCYEPKVIPLIAEKDVSKSQDYKNEKSSFFT